MGRRFGRSYGRQTVVKTYGAEIVYRFEDVHLDQWAKRFEEVGLNMRDMEPVFDEFGRYLVKENIPETFRKKGRPKRWAKLSPSYSMRRYGSKNRIATLILSGKMKRMFKWKAHPRSMQIINRRQVGRYFLWELHQSGTSKMPKRVILQLMRQDKSKFLDIAHEHVHKEARVR